MRITTANAFDSSVDNLQRRQQELRTAQDQLTSGKRVHAPATTRPPRRAPSARSRPGRAATPTSARSKPAATRCSRPKARSATPAS